jgi:hypothetical protein
MEDLKDRVKSLEALVEVLYHTILPSSRRRSPSPLARRRERSRSPLPRERSPIKKRREREYSDVNIHVKGWQQHIEPKDVSNYIEDKYRVIVTACSTDTNGYSGCIRLRTSEDQNVVLDNSDEISKYFGFVGLQKRLVH